MGEALHRTVKVVRDDFRAAGAKATMIKWMSMCRKCVNADVPTPLRKYLGRGHDNIVRLAAEVEDFDFSFFAHHRCSRGNMPKLACGQWYHHV